MAIALTFYKITIHIKDQPIQKVIRYFQNDDKNQVYNTITEACRKEYGPKFSHIDIWEAPEWDDLLISYKKEKGL